MATHSLTALVAQRYGGKQLKPGDQFEAETSHARMLVAIKRAAYTEDKAEKPAPKPKPAAKTMPAEPAQAPEPAAPASTAVPGMTTKQVYKRRDLTPE